MLILYSKNPKSKNRPYNLPFSTSENPKFLSLLLDCPVNKPQFILRSQINLDRSAPFQVIRSCERSRNNRNPKLVIISKMKMLGITSTNLLCLQISTSRARHSCTRKRGFKNQKKKRLIREQRTQKKILQWEDFCKCQQ